MREDYRDWLAAQGYSDNTCTAQVSRVQRLEQSYGPLGDLIDAGGYDALFAELSYSADDERHNRPNRSRLVINGNQRNSLASYKDALARYKRFLAVESSALPTSGFVPAADPALPAEPAAEKQRLSLERDMQAALRERIASLEPGLSIIDDGAERAVTSGFIDILARDEIGALVVIELKAGKTDARVIGQTLGYMGDILSDEDGAAVRGIIVAHAFDQRTISAARAVPNLRLVRYAISFSFTPEA